jgi:serine-type D-Ala-D-Ala carboxypeptidase (penicillin-binding protein 5/6)
LVTAVIAAVAVAAPATATDARAQSDPDPTPPPFEACPVADVQLPPNRPPLPQRPPLHHHGDRTIGGVGLATEGLAVSPNAADLPDNLSATYWLVADLDTGDVLGACGPFEYATPASTIKLLLALALLDELDPEELVEVLDEDLRFEPGSSAVGLVAGGEYTVETLWLGLLLNSGNDAANALARVGGGEDGVAGTLAAMNATAQRLGAQQTQAVTPSGLDAPGQFTSAYDLALIARALFHRDDFAAYIATPHADIPEQPSANARGFQIQNQNQLLGSYSGALGGKTGFTSVARHAFVGAAERDGRRLVVTLLGAEAVPARSWQQAAALLDWGFSSPRSATVGRLVEPGETALLAFPPDEGVVDAGRAGPAPEPSALARATVWAVWAVAALALVVFVGAVLLLLIGRIMAMRR